MISGVLVQCTRNRKSIHYVSHFFIMGFTANCLTDKKDQTGHCNHDGILYCMTFLFSTVLFLLFILINRMRNLPFSSIMKQDRLNIAVFRKFSQASGKYFVGLCRNKSHSLKTQRRIWVKQCTNVLQCFCPIPKQAAWYSWRGLFFRYTRIKKRSGILGKELFLYMQKLRRLLSSLPLSLYSHKSSSWAALK